MTKKQLGLQESLKIFYIAVLLVYIDLALFFFFEIAGSGLPSSLALHIVEGFFFASMGSLAIIAIFVPFCAVLERATKINYIGFISLVAITVLTFLTISVNMHKISDWIYSAGIDIFDMVGAVLALGLFFIVEFVVIRIVQKRS